MYKLPKGCCKTTDGKSADSTVANYDTGENILTEDAEQQDIWIWTVFVPVLRISKEFSNYYSAERFVYQYREYKPIMDRYCANKHIPERGGVGTRVVRDAIRTDGSEVYAPAIHRWATDYNETNKSTVRTATRQHTIRNIEN